MSNTRSDQGTLTTNMPEANHYVDPDDSDDGELELPISNPGIKLTPNKHGRFFDDMRGASEARLTEEEEPKTPRPLPRSVRRCLEQQSENGADGAWW
jgi:hypothetical protein